MTELRVLHSHWSMPQSIESKDINQRFKGGWLEYKYNVFSTALSLMLLKGHYGSVHLTTDDRGADLLIHKLKLPYDSYDLNLNDLNHISPSLWTFSKVFVFNLQDVPFLHVDNDVYLWEKLPEDLLSKSLFAQSNEDGFGVYTGIIPKVITNCKELPSDLTKLAEHNSFDSLNSGIIGGSDISFFRDAYQYINDIIVKHKDWLEKEETGMVNLFVEQFLLKHFAKINNKQFYYLFQRTEENYSDLTKFFLVPYWEGYIHTVGSSKKSIFACEQIEARLKYEFPDIYSKLVKLLPDIYPDYEKGIKEERWLRLKKIYELFYDSSRDLILERPFKLNDKIEFIEHGQLSVEEKKRLKSIRTTYEEVVKAKSPQTGMNILLPLVGLGQILPFFKKPHSIRDIHRIMTSGLNPSKEEKNSMLKSICATICEHAVYYDILRPV